MYSESPIFFKIYSDVTDVIVDKHFPADIDDSQSHFDN